MDTTINIDLASLARDLDLPVERVQRTLELLDEGNTVPFITRYRKDQTGGLDEEQIRRIQASAARMRALAERKQTIRKTIEAQGKLTPELAAAIEHATSAKRLEDLYLPFKPKKQTLATQARQRGLEPLATKILEATTAEGSVEELAAAYVAPDLGLASVADVLQGVRHLLAERISESADLRERLRRVIRQQAKLVVTRIEPPARPAEPDAPPANNPAANSLAANSLAPDSAAPPTDEVPATEAATAEVSTTDAPPIDSPQVDEAPAPAEAPAAEGASAPAAAEAVATTEGAVEGATAEAAPVAEASEPAAPTAAAPTAAAPTVESPTVESPTVESPTVESPTVAASAAPDAAPAPVPADRGATARRKAKGQRANKKEKKRQKLEAAFKDYFKFSESLSRIPPHRVLAINRGERARILRVKLEVDAEAIQGTATKAAIRVDHPYGEFLATCLRDAMQRLIMPSLEREIRRELTEWAEEHAVEVFVRNLRNLLLQPPVQGRRVLAVDPGFRSGCKLIVLDQFGNVLGHDMIHVIGREDRRRDVRHKIARVIRQYGISVVAIGNGTGCREAEQLVADAISEELQDLDVAYVIVNEAGASVYSTSPLGREELPDYDAVMRGAISIGRRLLDPLSELVKINPANIGVGLYQHDVKAKHLRDSLDAVVESAVNYVGVDVNTASPALLRYVSGLNQLTARRLYEYRRDHGPFRSREDLRKVPGLGEAGFVQAAGFLKIHGDNPLDATWIHPESYDVAVRVLERIGADLEWLRTAVAPPPREEPAEVSSTPADATPPASAGAEDTAQPSESAQTGEAGSVEAGSVEAGSVEAGSVEAGSVEAGSAGAVEAAADVSAEPPSAEATPTPEAAASTEPAATTEPADATESSAVEQPTAAPEATEPAADAAEQPAAEASAAEPSAEASAEKTSQAELRSAARSRLAEQAARFPVQELANELGVGELLLRDILAAITRPGRDPREDLPSPVFRRGIMKLEDLQTGMELTGTVLNVVDFGVFVDIGLSDSGLVHISRLADRYIRDPHEVVGVGDTLKVWVLDVDRERRRVSLTAVAPGTERKRPEPRQRGQRGGRKPQKGAPAQAAGQAPAGAAARAESPETATPPAAGQQRSAQAGQQRPAQAGQQRSQRSGQSGGGRGGQRSRGNQQRSGQPRTWNTRSNAPAKPISKEMEEGREPLRSFSDLLQFYEKKQRPEDQE